MEVGDTDDGVAGAGDVAEPGVEPVSGGGFAREPAEAGVPEVVRVEGEEFAVSEGRVGECPQEPTIGVAEPDRRGGGRWTVGLPALPPGLEGGHPAVLEDRGASVRFQRGLADFLSVVEEDGAAADTVQDGTDGRAHEGAVAAPMRGVGEPDFVVVLGVAEGVVQGGAVGEGGVEVVRPLWAVVEILEDPIGGVVVDGVEPGIDEFVEDVAGGELVGVVVVGLGEEEGVGPALAGSRDGPFPERDGNPVGHVAAEAVDPGGLPVGEDGVHERPGGGHGVARGAGEGEVSEAVGTAGEVVAVVELHGLEPVVGAGGGGGDVVAGDAGLGGLGGEGAVASAEGDAGGGGGVALVDGGQAEGALPGEVEEVVVAGEEPGSVVVEAGFEVGADDGVMAAGDVVGDEVDQDAQVVAVGALDEGRELLEAAVGIGGEVGADVEEVADGEGGAGDALEEVGVIGGEAGVRGAGGVAEDAEEPEVGAAEVAEGGEGWVGDVGEGAAAVAGAGSVGDGIRDTVAEEAGEELVENEVGSSRIQAGSPAGGLLVTSSGWHGGRGVGRVAGMSLLPFGELPAHTPRRFLPLSLDLGNWEALKPWVDRLEERGRAAGTVAELEAWLVDAGEFGAALDEERARRYIAMTCHTDDPSAEKSYLQFVEEVDPQLKPRFFALAQLYLGHPMRASLPEGRYEVLDRNKVLEVELFRDENVPLETEEAKLSQQYQKLSGSLTVSFRGEERTVAQMGRYQEETDRGLREEAWRAVGARWMRDADEFERIFDGLRDLRGRIASNAGFPDYRAYAFRARGRFDYGPDDCLRFHDAIESEVMPVYRALQRERRGKLGLERLRPWDTSVDPEGRAPLRPFQDTGRLEDGTHRIFERMDGRLASAFGLMREKRLLDLANRKGKAPGGYQYTLSEARLPFIFMNAVGQQRDLETLLHEAGHAFHALASRDEPLHAYRDAPIEFCEVASMAMELLAAEGLDEFYGPEEARRARRTHLEGIVGVFPWIATVDAFQHWIYTHPGHTVAERRVAWLGLMDRFGGDVDWSGFEDVRATRWHRQLHIFIHPFYYVEYGIAQLGALQVWANARKDAKRALDQYLEGLALGGSRPLPELFERAGCRFDFSRETLKPLLELVRRELEALG